MPHKPTLVILPGWGGSHETWADFIDLASDNFDVQCIDLPCFGNEPSPSTVWGIEEYAQFIKSKIEKLVLSLSEDRKSKITLLGHSFGGQVAAYFVAMNPEMADKLVLIGASAIRPKQIVRRALFGVIATVGKAILSLPPLKRFYNTARRLFLRGIGAHDSIAVEGMKREIYKKVIRQDLRHILPQIAVPTLVLWGSRDSMTPLRQGKKIAQLIPKAKLSVISGGKHGLHLTHAKAIIDEVYDFDA